MCQLAEIAIACYTERLEYLEAASKSGEALEREHSVFGATYRTARPQFIRPLVGVGRSDRAFALAEQYEDYRTLVELCNEPTLRNEARTETYLERYGESFAFELYNWYEQHGLQRTLLTQKAEYSHLVQAYLAQPGKDRLGWLHDLALGKFDAASSKLEKLGLVEGNLAQRRMMLSLGKLGYLSTLGVKSWGG